MTVRSPRALARAVIGVALLQVLALPRVHAQVPDGTPEPLSDVKVPRPTNVFEFVGGITSETVAIQLGKALFWDMQLGSDGRQACPTSHFNAGMDRRLRNTANPDTNASPGVRQSFGALPPNSTLALNDFPLLQPTVVGSEGVILTKFTDIKLGSARDVGVVESDKTFQVGGVPVRQVGGRHAPSVINAVFNHRNFWDGRAKNVFNGVDPFGNSNPNPQVFEYGFMGKIDIRTDIRLDNASLCSQATGPGTSKAEMSWDGRTWPKIGKKLLHLQPLAEQRVARDDSVLGPLAGAKGLTVTYADLIKKSFDSVWWLSTEIVTFDTNGVAHVHPRPNRELTTDEYTQMEANFSLIFGVAVQLYLSTLVADQSPFDKYCAAAKKGEDSTVMDSVGQHRARAGLAVFLGDVGYVDKHNGARVRHSGRCVVCHGGAETTNASVSHVTKTGLIETATLWGGAAKALFDTGYRNTAVRPIDDDKGLGGLDGWKKPLSFVRLEGKSSPAVDGAFKIPGLRNVALRGPYFHDGGKATLMQVVDFYNGGGDFFGQNLGSMDDELRLLLNDPMDAEEKSWVVDLLMAMTDPRVEKESAPFDHPELFVADGAVGSATKVETRGGAPVDQVLQLPAVGKNGSATKLEPFLNLDPHQP